MYKMYINMNNAKLTTQLSVERQTRNGERERRQEKERVVRY